MLRTGKEHTASLRDGRVVYIGSESVDDVTQHSAFRNAAQTVAAIYDMKADPANRDVMSYEEDAGRHSMYFLRAKSRDDLQRRDSGVVISGIARSRRVLVDDPQRWYWDILSLIKFRITSCLRR